MESSDLYLNFWEEEFKTRWCWIKREPDGSDGPSSQVFKSKSAAIAAMNRGALVWTRLSDIDPEAFERKRQ